MLFPSISSTTLLALALLQPAMALPKFAGNSTVTLTPIANATTILNRAVPSDLAAAVRPHKSSGRVTAKDLDMSASAALPTSTGQLISSSISTSLGTGHIVKERALPTNSPPFPSGNGSLPFPRPSGAPTGCPSGPMPSGVPATVASFFASLCSKQTATSGIAQSTGASTQARASVPAFRSQRPSGAPTGCPSGPIPSGVPASVASFFVSICGKATGTAVSGAAQNTGAAVVAGGLQERAVLPNLPTGAHPSVPASISSFFQGLSTAVALPTNLPSGSSTVRPSKVPKSVPNGFPGFS